MSIAWSVAVERARANAPYLARLMQRRPDLLAALDDANPRWPFALADRAIEDARALAANAPEIESGMRELRRAKDAAHLGLALAEIAANGPGVDITRTLSEFADAALAAAFAMALRVGVERGDLRAGVTAENSGIALIAMGKMGAFELNYSSDIDFSVFFEPEQLPVAPGKEPRVVAVRLVAPLVRALEEITADGYVFRTDLRLRPDPGATPTAVSIRAAEHYYQHLGQNWERAAFIKARAAGGDIALGQEFLGTLEPFIWRKHLGYAAIADVQSIKRQILTVNKSAELASAVFDVKLGRGGIRDIELFAQTQQLILGGRHRALRSPRTLEALDALAEHGAVSRDDADRLASIYKIWRRVEHGIQMMEDEQTQRLPSDGSARARLAAIYGFPDLATLDNTIIANRAEVARIDATFFDRSDSLADPLGALVFTGVEDHAETIATLRALGFERPSVVAETVRGWHHGRIRAMRSERARELLTALTPKLLRALAESGAPDIAFARFATFFAGLVAGVETLSMFANEPRLMSTIANALGAAPRLADALARRPVLMDAMIEARFDAPLASDQPGTRVPDLRQRIHEARDYEGALNAARRFHREESFRISLQVLTGKADPETAGAAYADLAEACVTVLAEAAERETTRLFGAAPGAYTILALGKFGGRELSEGSDLDMMIVYEQPEGTPGEFYTRFTQRLISALSAPTEEGQLFDVDMQLRPSGSKGPVAVRLSSFERYYSEEAWTWELMALTRLRPVAGDPRLSARALGIKDAALTRLRAPEKIKSDAAAMRALMERERPGHSVWDLKLAPGGLVDVEFVAQVLLLTTPGACDPNTGVALENLIRRNGLDGARGRTLLAAWRLYGGLQQVLRISITDGFSPAEASPTLKARLAAVAGVADFPALEQLLAETQDQVRAIFRDLVGSPSDGNPTVAR